MGASRCVGRVGGLAVALGVGAALLSTGCGVALADDSAKSAPSASSDNNTGSTDSGSSGSHSKAGAAANRSANSDSGKVTSSGGARSSSKHARVTTAPDNTSVAGGSTSTADDKSGASDSSAGQGASAAAVSNSTAGANSGSSTVSVTPRVAAATKTLTPAPAASISGLITTAIHDLFDPLADGSPTQPVDSPLALALAAFTRREAASTLSSTATAAQTTASLTVGNNPIVVTPTLTPDHGILVGQNYATAPTGTTLVYTLISAPDKGGKVTFSATTDPNYVLGNFSYLPDQSVLGGGASNEKFTIMVAQSTAFDQALGAIPIVGALATPIINLLHQTPILGDVLAPVIGYASFATFNSNTVLPTTDPVAYTYKLKSFDDVLISVNWFPAVGLGATDKAETVLNGPGLASAGQTDPYQLYGISGLTPGVANLRDAGYNVVTWDPRGEFASGGVLQLDNPFFEGRDVSAIVSWVAGLSNSVATGNDPVVGMVGGSYGGGIQLVSAATDPRIDAIVPGIAWNSLNNSLYPDGSFKTSYGSLLLLSLITSGARINNQIYLGVLSGDLIGYLSQTAEAVLGSSGPTSLLNNLDVPVLFLQGTVDVLFTLQQAIDNAQTVLANGNTDVKMVWYCGGHGVCLTGPTSPNPNIDNTLTFLNEYLKGTTPPPADVIPTFQYTDQKGAWYKANYLPVSGSSFFGAPKTVLTNADGGLLGIVPFLGGSGPGQGVSGSPYQTSLPYSLGLGSKASNAINVQVDTTGVSQIVGSPTLTFDYQGLGTNRFVYAQLVDNATGLVVGNLVTPVAVTMDGQVHTATVDMENIVYTVANPAVDNLTLQITSASTAYWSLTSYGVINISKINLTVPTPATITPETL